MGVINLAADELMDEVINLAADELMDEVINLAADGLMDGDYIGSGWVH